MSALMRYLFSRTFSACFALVFLAFPATASLNPVPTITSISTNRIVRGVSFTETITGNNFIPGSTVVFQDGTSLTVVSRSATAITVSGTSSSSANTYFTVQVVNPTPGGGASNSITIGVVNPISVTISPKGPALLVSASQSFSSFVGYSTNQAVKWAVNGISGGNAAVGTITSSGLYTAPTVVPSVSVKVSATSVADPTKSDFSSVTIQNPVPTIASVASSQGKNTIVYRQPFQLIVTGTHFVPGSTLTLSDGTALTITSRSPTQIVASGTSSSPAETAIAVQVHNPAPGARSSNTKPLNIVPQTMVTVGPKTQIVRCLASSTLKVWVDYAQNKTVTWAVNGVVGGSSSIGTIDASGKYTAPAIPPAASVTITATSVADPTKSDSALVTLQNAIPVIVSAKSPVTAAPSATVSITGSGFAKSAQVHLGAAAMSVNWISSTQLTATGPIKMPPGGILPVIVHNPAPGPATSNQVAISIQTPGTELSYAQAKHFLELATWGPTPDSIAHLQSIGIDAWLNEQFDSITTPESTYTAPVDQTSSIAALQNQFFLNALTGKDQLRQRVAFALGQILVVSGVYLDTYAEMMPYQQLLLKDAFGKYGDLLRDATLNPAMGVFLNMVNSDIPSAKYAPNENYSRELMQLFTIGTTQLGANGVSLGSPTYTQNDVRALARAFTGWTFPPCGNTSRWPNPPCYEGQMVANEAHHDNGEKLVLGTNIQTGSASSDLDAALNVIENYKSSGSTVPNIATFVSLRLIQHLVTGDPPPAYVARVAAIYAATGGDLKQVVTAILTDSAAAPGSPGHLREPVFFAVSVLRALNVQASGGDPLSWNVADMGQNVFSPQSVFSYYSPFYVLPGTTTVGPEYQIFDQPASIFRSGWAYRVSRNMLHPYLVADLSNFIQLASDTNPKTQGASLTTMLNAVSQAFLGTPMPSDMATAIMPAMLATTDPTARAENAVFLVASSPQYQVQQ